MRALLAKQLAIAAAVTLPLATGAAAAVYRSVEPARGEVAFDQRTPQNKGGQLTLAQSPSAAADETVHNFYFTRAAYNSGYRRSSWAVDYPQADLWFASVLNRLTGIDVSPAENPVRLDDPNLRRFPFLYAVEVGYMRLRQEEVDGLRSYLLAGGFLAVDDFWGSEEWYYFEQEIKRVLPEYEIVEIPLDHEIFATFYQIEEVVQVPNVDQGVWGGPTHEGDGYVPHFRGIFDDEGRLMVVINWNTDLGDAWEWAELSEYPLKYSTYAYQVGANFIMYAMTR